MFNSVCRAKLSGGLVSGDDQHKLSVHLRNSGGEPEEVLAALEQLAGVLLQLRPVNDRGGR